MLLYNKRRVKNKWTIKTKYSTHGCKDMKKKKKRKRHLKSFMKEKIMENAKPLTTERKKNYKLQLFKVDLL